MLRDRAGDDRHCRWNGCGIDLLQWVGVHEVQQAAGRKRRY
jgi:hypothetical protein